MTPHPLLKAICFTVGVIALLVASASPVYARGSLLWMVLSALVGIGWILLGISLQLEGILSRPDEFQDLRMRFARGEISEEEYEQRRRDLSEEH